jgi:vacuolar protein sorting-associated protein 13A/C
MSLVKMDNLQEQVRFMDDLDLTFVMDSRKSATEQRTSIDIDAKPIVFRASYRDIMLITSIANRAVELSSKTAPPNALGSDKSMPKSTRRMSSRRQIADVQTMFSEQPRIIMSKEQVGHQERALRLIYTKFLHS